MDEQVDNYYEVISINKSLSEQNYCFKILVLLHFIYIVFVISKQNI